MEKYKFILDFEIKQMLNGDIPIFTLNSQNHILEGNSSLKVFEKNVWKIFFIELTYFLKNIKMSS
jgi:lantibiotic modifying enzyme